MNPIRKQALKLEFETSNLSLDQLLDKYKLSPEEVGDTSRWEKTASRQALVSNPPDHIAKPPVTPGELVDDEDIMDDIMEAKKEALRVAKQFFTDLEIEEVTPKDIKDMMGVIKDIESGELAKRGKGIGGHAPIQVIVQNLVSRFEDDC